MADLTGTAAPGPMAAPHFLDGVVQHLFDTLSDRIAEVVRESVRTELTNNASRPAPHPDELLDTRAAMAFTGRSESTLRRWRELGLEVIQPERGGKVNYTRAGLLAFMRSRSISAAGSAQEPGTPGT